MYTKARGDFIGRLSKDSELRYTSNGSAVANFTLVTDDSVKNQASGEYENIPSFWDCQMWGKQAEKLNQYLTKGKLIGLDGKIRIEKWEKDGQQRMKVSINVNDVVFIAGQGNHAGAGENTSHGASRSTSGNSRQPAHPPANQSDDFESDIPF